MKENTIIKISGIVLLVLISILLASGGGRTTSGTRDAITSAATISKNELRNGVQYIHIAARGGYLPQSTVAKAGVPTKLIVTTNGTYDCSSSLRIRDVGYSAVLPATGETEIDLGIHGAGEKIAGVCSMGMYGFEVRFVD